MRHHERWWRRHLLRRACHSTDHFIAHQGTCVEGGLDTNSAYNFFFDRSWACVRGDAHVTRDTICQISYIFGGIDSAVPMTALSSDQKSITFLESMDPTWRKFRRVFILISRQLSEY